MTKEVDDKYQNLAVDALHSRLVGHKLLDQHCDMEGVSAELLRAFEISGDILRSNRESDGIRDAADFVFISCIYLARCLYFPDEARTIVLNGDEHALDAESQQENLRRNMRHLKTMLENA